MARMSAVARRRTVGARSRLAAVKGIETAPLGSLQGRRMQHGEVRDVARKGDTLVRRRAVDGEVI